MRSIRDYLQGAVEDGAFPGAAWVVGTAGSVLEQGCTGTMGIGLGPVQEDTLYDLASLTKIFVSLCLMRQLEEGLLRLEDTAGYFLSGYREVPKSRISLFELLTHTSVIPDLPRLHRYAHTKEDILEAIRQCPERAGSPRPVEYTCEGYILLGEILQAASGLPLDAAIRVWVTDPLGMAETGYLPSPALASRIAPTEHCSWRGRIVRGEVHDGTAAKMGGVSGNAGIFSTATDVAKIAAAMLGGEPGKEPFLSPSTLALMTRNHTSSRGQNRGLGWLLAGPGSPAGDLMSLRSFGHTGFSGVSLWVDPAYGLYGVLLTNRIHPSRANDEIIRCRHIFHNLIILNYRENAK